MATRRPCAQVAAVRRSSGAHRQRLHSSPLIYGLPRVPAHAVEGGSTSWTERGPGVPAWSQAAACPTAVLPLLRTPYTDGRGKSLTANQVASTVREVLSGHALAGLRCSGLAFTAPVGAAAVVVDDLRQHALEQLRLLQDVRCPELLEADHSFSTDQLAVRRRLSALAARLRQGLVERDAELKLSLLALICAEHVLLYGPSGSGKSLLGRRLSKAVLQDPTSVEHGGVPFFERQLSRFSVPEELLGPVSLEALRQGGGGDDRSSAGYLPSATVGFIDHIFNASSGLLNSLLTLLNERTLGTRTSAACGSVDDNDSHGPLVRLRTVVGTSEKPPEGAELAPLHDRFLFAAKLSPVSRRARLGLLDRQPEEDEIDEQLLVNSLRLTVEEMDTMKAEAIQSVQIPEEVSDRILELLELLDQDQLSASLQSAWFSTTINSSSSQQRTMLPCVSSSSLTSSSMSTTDRRLVRAGDALRIAAWTSGRDSVSLNDGLLLAYIFNRASTASQTTRDVGELSEEILKWWMERLHLPPAAALQAVAEVGDVLSEAWEAIEMAAEAAAYSSHLADTVLESHVRPSLLPALTKGVHVLSTELRKIKTQRQRDLEQAVVAVDKASVGDRCGPTARAVGATGAACIWLSEELNEEVISRRYRAIQESAQMIETAALEMLLLHEIVTVGPSGEQRRCSALWNAGAGAVVASTPTLTASAARTLLGRDGNAGSAPPRWSRDMVVPPPSDANVSANSCAKGLALLAAAGLGQA